MRRSGQAIPWADAVSLGSIPLSAMPCFFAGPRCWPLTVRRFLPEKYTAPMIGMGGCRPILFRSSIIIDGLWSKKQKGLVKEGLCSKSKRLSIAIPGDNREKNLEERIFEIKAHMSALNQL